MSENGTTRRRAAESAPALTPPVLDAPAAIAEMAKTAKPRRAPAPIDPETRAMRRIESVLADLAEADPTAPTRVLEYLLARRKSRAMFAPREPEYPHAGP